MTGNHFDDLNTLLSLLECNFSFISITETRMLRDQESFLDFSMPGYSEVSTPTESTAGGVMSVSYTHLTLPTIYSV